MAAFPAAILAQGASLARSRSRSSRSRSSRLFPPTRSFCGFSLGLRFPSGALWSAVEGPHCGSGRSSTGLASGERTPLVWVPPESNACAVDCLWVSPLTWGARVRGSPSSQEMGKGGRSSSIGCLESGSATRAAGTRESCIRRGGGCVCLFASVCISLF